MIPCSIDAYGVLDPGVFSILLMQHDDRNLSYIFLFCTVCYSFFILYSLTALYCCLTVYMSFNTSFGLIHTMSGQKRNILQYVISAVETQTEAHTVISHLSYSQYSNIVTTVLLRQCSCLCLAISHYFAVTSLSFSSYIKSQLHRQL